MRILTPDRKYMYYWLAMVVVMVAPFYYLAYKMARGWPNK